MLYDTEYVEQTIEQQYDLIRRAQNGDIAARDEMVEANIPLVIDAVRKYRDRIRDLDDLAQEVALSLVEAIKRFDLSSGNRFSTYAKWWIKAYLYRALANYSIPMIRVPAHIWEKTLKIRRALERTNGVEIDPAYLAEQTGVPVHEVEAILPWLFRTITSIDVPVDPEREDSAFIVEMLPDEQDEFEASNIAYEVERYLSILDERERDVIELVYGLGKYRYDYLHDNLADAGRVFGHSKDVTRRAHNEALRKMREVAIA